MPLLPSVSLLSDRQSSCLPVLCSSLFFLLLWIWSSEVHRLPASSSRWRTSTDHLELQLSVLTCSSFGSSFLLSFLHTKVLPIFCCLSSSVDFFPVVISACCSAVASGSEVSLLPLSSVTRSAVSPSVPVRISPSLFLGFHNTLGPEPGLSCHSEAGVDFILLFVRKLKADK